MDIRKHLDTLVLLGAICSGFLWINGKFNDIEGRLIRIETVLVMRGIMPEALANEGEK